MSDEAILECENELKKAGVVALLRPGDIVWDTALGDEGNVGRLAWDGRYLIVRIPVVVYHYHFRGACLMLCFFVVLFRTSISRILRQATSRPISLRSRSPRRTSIESSAPPENTTIPSVTSTCRHGGTKSCRICSCCRIELRPRRTFLFFPSSPIRSSNLAKNLEF